MAASYGSWTGSRPRLLPVARHYRLGNERVNYIRNSVKATVDAYDGTVTFYVFDPDDPVIGGYRRIFPSLFRDAADMSADLRSHVRYPELLLELQAAVFGLYHMTSPDVFYNREDLWTVASEVRSNDPGQQAAQTFEPNFVLMKLPGEQAIEFVEIQPFTPANRNNLIGWIAGRSDGPNYGKAVVYDSQDAARGRPAPDRGPHRSERPAVGTAVAVNQQGSHVRRGTLIVIPVGKGLVRGADLPAGGAQPDAGTADCRARTQDRLARSEFETASPHQFGNVASTLGSPVAAGGAPAARPSQPAARHPAGRRFSCGFGDERRADSQRGEGHEDYQRPTSEGKPRRVSGSSR